MNMNQRITYEFLIIQSGLFTILIVVANSKIELKTLA
jgi:hypothetical protein